TARSLLARDGEVSDIAAAEAAGPVDCVDAGVGAALRLGDARAGAADIEHAPAVGEHRAVGRHLGAGMEDLDAVELAGGVEPADRRATSVFAGVTLGCHDHGERGV